MHIKKLLMVSIILAVSAFSLYGLNELINSKINPVQASAPTPNQPATLTLVNASTAQGGQTVSTIEIVPTPEMPARAPDAAGIFSGQDGNTLTLQSFLVTTDGAQVNFATGGAIMGTAPEGTPQAGLVIVSGSAASPASEGQGVISQPEGGSTRIELQDGATIVGQGMLESIPPLPDGASASVTFSSGLPSQASTQKIVVTDATKLYHDVTPMPGQPAAGIQSIQQVLEAGSLNGLTAAQSMVTVWGHQDGDQLVADVIVYQNPLLLK